MQCSRLSDVAYVVGEQQYTYDVCESFHSVVKDAHLFVDPSFFGWGKCYRSNEELIDLGLKSAALTLNQTTVNRQTISLVIFCSTKFGDFKYGQAEDWYGRILQELDLSCAHILGITLNNCTGLLSALSIANAYVRSGSHQSVLVICSDKVSQEKHRFTDYALFSDAAASCIISTSAGKGFKILAEAFGSNHDAIRTRSVFSDIDLYRQLGEKLVRDAGTAADQIKMVFSSNMFLPILRLKETAFGIPQDKIYTDNVPLVGHCFSADPLINMSDYSKGNDLSPGERFVLASNAPGLRASLLVTPVTDT